ncbi:hypothetical protein HGA88_06560 [Candidatus Roizmanbacteria bacterium]|nr:hypothetical protein [Candidatus Roizmanbacteria bacterium]
MQFYAIIITPLYQSIRSFQDITIPSGAGDELLLEPLLLEYLSHFSKLMDVFQEDGKEVSSDE